jgi:DNA-binding Lrp family transcriptional regulator
MTTGPSDLLCRIVARDNDHLGHLLTEILEVPGITRTTTSLVLATRIAPRVLPLITST